jgi:tyrosinase
MCLNERCVWWAVNPGNNTVRRRSTESSVTIPYERTFRDQTARPGDAGGASAADFDFCGCGWPHHMLVPKGTQMGYPVVLYVMVSNWNDDMVSLPAPPLTLHAIHTS